MIDSNVKYNYIITRIQYLKIELIVYIKFQSTDNKQKLILR